MRKLAEKTRARNLASKLGIPVTPGSGILRDVEEAVTISNEIGYPVMLKAAYGGGGIGINRCNNELEVRKEFDVSKQQALKAFGNSVMFVEKCIKEVQHVEVQVFGDGDGQVVVMGERECSVQRRNQKVLEATPAPGLSDEARRNILEAAHTLTKSIQYQSAGTVEFLINRQTKEFFFMEVNMRLQVRKTTANNYYVILNIHCQLDVLLILSQL
jgi:urea carboxylase